MSRELLQTFKESQGLSQSKLATMLGVSSTTISQYLSGVYMGDTDTLDKKVREMIERAKDKANDIKSDFVATATAKNIMDVCAMAHAMNDINLVIGEAGLGKTMALKHYAENTEGVVLIETAPTFSPKVLLIELCQKIGVVPSRNNHDNITAIVEKLKGSDRLIIIDEAELLSYKCLEVIRRIHDMAGIGIVLAGMPRLRANLRGKRGEYKQLYSRVGFACDIKDRLPDDDVLMLACAALGHDGFGDKLINASHGNARRLNKILRGVNRLVKMHNRPADEKAIDKVCHMLID